MQIKGLQKLTLLDYKGYLAATIFTGGCNFTCPFCHNKDLVLFPNTVPDINEDSILHFLDERKNRLEAVCITGGEPTLQKDLAVFLMKIKNLGYKIKLDTNGTSPDILIELMKQNLIDYIAMDIKNSQSKYAFTAGVSHIDIEKINQSIKYITNSTCDYEFRTTVTKELHSESDILSIANWIHGAKAYYLQPYKCSPQVIKPVYTSYNEHELVHLLESVAPFVEKCGIIG